MYIKCPKVDRAGLRESLVYIIIRGTEGWDAGGRNRAMVDGGGHGRNVSRLFGASYGSSRWLRAKIFVQFYRSSHMGLDNFEIETFHEFQIFPRSKGVESFRMVAKIWK